MRRARSFLECADDDLDAGRWVRAISQFLLRHLPRGQGSPGLDHSHAVKHSDFPSKVAGTLVRLEQMRLTADYDAVEWETFTGEQARDAADEARSFVEEAEKWLQWRGQGRALA